MKFSEQKAIELIEKHGLAKGTIATWRKRDSIPEKYAGEIPAMLGMNEAQQQQAANMLRGLKAGKLNIASVCRHSKIEEKRMRDIMREKSKFAEPDFLSLKRTVNTVRNDAKNILSQLGTRNTANEQTIKAIEKLLKREEINLLVLLNRDRELYNKFDGWIAGRRSFPADYLNHLKSALLIFLTETTI